MKTILLLASAMLFSQNAFTKFDPKEIGTDAQVMTRALDLLFAREEMKQSMPAGFKLNTDPGPATSEIDRKVQLLTNTMALEDCVVDSKEVRSPDGKYIDATLSYKGGACPVAVNAIIHVVSENNEMNGTVQIRLDIVNEALKKELDITTAVIPAKLNVHAEQVGNNIELVVSMQISSQLHSQRFGVIDYTMNNVTRVNFMDFSTKSRVDETFSSNGGRIVFGQVITATASGQQTESYSIDGVSVSKEEFEARHANITLPGFDGTVAPLEQPHVCDITMYDAKIYSLENVRALLKDGKLATIPATERFPGIALTTTGKASAQAVIAGKQTEIEIEVSQEAARFDFKQEENRQPKSLGRMTVVLGAAVDLTKVIGTRVTHITCKPN